MQLVQRFTEIFVSGLEEGVGVERGVILWGYKMALIPFPIKNVFFPIESLNFQFGRTKNVDLLSRYA